MCKKNREKEYIETKHEFLTKEEKQKQKYKDYQKQYRENKTDEQKQKRRDYQKEYYKNYYAEKKLTINNIIIHDNFKNNLSH